MHSSHGNLDAMMMPLQEQKSHHDDTNQPHTLDTQHDANMQVTETSTHDGDVDMNETDEDEDDDDDVDRSSKPNTGSAAAAASAGGDSDGSSSASSDSDDDAPTISAASDSATDLAPDDDDPYAEYEVDRFLDRRPKELFPNARQFEYLVRWAKPFHDPKYDTVRPQTFCMLIGCRVHFC